MPGLKTSGIQTKLLKLYVQKETYIKVSMDFSSARLGEKIFPNLLKQMHVP